MLTFFLLYLACGMVIGFTAGLFGIGGGIIGIPALLFLFKLQGIPPAIAIHMAIGTSFATVIVTSAVSLYSHYLKKMVLFSVAKKIILGSLMGTVLGTLLSTHLNGLYLQRIFGLFIIALALQLFLRIEMTTRVKLQNTKKIVFMTTLIGTCSSMLGLGGGILMVPYLHATGIPMRHAIATATACILPAAMIGACGYMLVSAPLPATVPYHTGFIYWPAFFGLSLTSVIFAPIGVWVTHHISSSALKRVFSVFLFFIGISMLM